MVALGIASLAIDHVRCGVGLWWGVKFLGLAAYTLKGFANEKAVTSVVSRQDAANFYQKGFDREDLVALWSQVKERFRSAEPTEDMEKALWVELKRLFESDKDDVLWKLQRYMHDPLTWRLYDRRLQVEEDSEVARDLVMKIFIEANKPRS
ncbi:hypothetical protein Tco_1448069 [Tanacetum coccineum]